MRHDRPLHTSASQLACFASCPRKYEYRYVEQREPEHRSTALALGSAVHGAVAWWFDEKIAARTPDVGDALKILHADLTAALTYPNVNWRGESQESLLADGEKLLRLFLDKHGDLPVIATEVRFDMPIVDPDTGETMPRPCTGFLDLGACRANSRAGDRHLDRGPYLMAHGEGLPAVRHRSATASAA